MHYLKGFKHFFGNPIKNNELKEKNSYYNLFLFRYCQ